MSINRLKGKPLEAIPVAFLPTMSGAEDHSRTDTGSPPPVFEFDAGRITSSHDIPNMSFRSPNSGDSRRF